VAWEISDKQGVGRAVRELVTRTCGEYDFVVVSRELPDDLRAFVRWRRAPAPDHPYRLKLAVFAATAGFQLVRSRADLRHVHASGPTVANRVDLTTVRFLRAGFHEASGQPAGRFTRGQLALERWCLGRSRELSSISEGGARELERHVPGRKIRILPNGVDTDRFRPDVDARERLRDELGVAPDALVALFVGNTWHRKGLAVALEGLALAAAGQAAPDELWVLGYGEPRPYRELAERLDVGDRVRFLGLQSDVERFYQAADILVLPTSYVTFCQVAYEAAATALPVVATPVHGIDELIGDGRAGIPVARDPGEVARALTRLAADPELRRRLGEEGRRRALARSWNDAAAAVAAAYRELMGVRASRNAGAVS
jgi:glycosyltransferase involved in cell wall biosynthesis